MRIRLPSSRRDRAPAAAAGQRNRRDFLVLAWSADRPTAITLAGAIVIGGIGPALFMILAGTAVGGLPGAIRQGHPAGVLPPAVAAGAVFIVIQVAARMRFSLGEILGQRTEMELRDRALRAAAIGPGFDHLQDEETRNDLAVVNGIAGGLPLERAAAGMAEVTSSILAAAGPLVLLVFFRWWAALLVAAAWIGVRMVGARENQKRMELLFGQAHQLRRADYFRALSLDGSAAKETRIFGLKDWILGRLDAEWATAVRPTWASRRPSDKKILAATAVLILMYCAVTGLLVRAAADGAITLGAFAIFLQALIGAAAISGGTAAYGLDVALAPVAALRRLEHSARRPAPGGIRSAAALPREALEARDIQFGYGGSGEMALRGVSFRVGPGESVALVGANGAGKTTMLKLLAGLWPPSAGCVMVDGAPLGAFDLASWRHQLAAVFQDFARLPLTLAENVHMLRARPGSDATTRRLVVSCLERAGLGDKLGQLPAGVETVLGRGLPGGADLSGGEWQRVALARAFFAVERGARVLMVDEPTANIDPAAEVEFFDQLLGASAGLMRIVVSHRFSTVRRVDRILVLDRGEVTEEGSHDELMRQGGHYRDMFLAQALPFMDPGAPVAATTDPRGQQ